MASTPANNVGGDRRVCSLPQFPSCSKQKTYNKFIQGSNSGGLFSGLMNQKRNSTDAAAEARRQSFHDQKLAPGVIGKMWHK